MYPMTGFVVQGHIFFFLKDYFRIVLGLGLIVSHCCRYQGHIGSSLIVGGVDVNGPQLYSIYPHGSYDKLPFLTMGTVTFSLPPVFEWTQSSKMLIFKIKK